MSDSLSDRSASRDLTWGADCDGCEERMNAGRAQLAAEVAGDGPLLCGSCRDEARAGAEIARLRVALEEATGAFSAWSGARRDAMKYGGSSAREYDRLVRAMIAAREALNGGEDG
jgi:hypothetical protein